MDVDASPASSTAHFMSPKPLATASTLSPAIIRKVHRAFCWKNGARAYPVSEVTIAGNLRDIFAQLSAASDLQMRYALNAPTLATTAMTVAGA